MTALSDLITRASGAGTVQVGASALFPILSIVEDLVPSGVESANGAPLITRSVVIDSVAIAGGESAAAVGALKESLRADLARRGTAVSIVEAGGTARVFRAGGDVTGLSGAGRTSAPGYPAVKIAFDAERSVGAVQFFRLTIDCVEREFPANTGSYAVVTHKASTSLDEDANGNVTVRVRGSVVLKPGQNAAGYIESAVFAAARSDAQADGDFFTARVTTPENADASSAEYEYTVANPNAGGGYSGTATHLEETDTTTTSNEGRVTRSVSGSVTGSGAVSVATGRQPSIGAGQVLRSKRVDAPSTPGNKVSYAYEVVSGLQAVGFSGTSFFSFSQTASRSGGGRALLTGVYDDANPVLAFGPLLPYVVTETTDMEYTGTTPTLSSIPRVCDVSLQAAEQAYDAEARERGVRRLRVVRVYASATAPTVAAPHELTAV